MSNFETLLTILQELEVKTQQAREALGKFHAAIEMSQSSSVPAASAFGDLVMAPTAEEEIVDGEETDDFPDCCAVGNDEGYFCSGTLVAPKVVITADHCPDIKRVYLRGKDVSRSDDGETIAVVKEIVHPELDFKILILKDASRVKPRRIATLEEANTATTVMLAGFGTVDLNGRIGYGLKRKLPYEIPITSLACDDANAPKLHGCMPGREIVAGQRGMRRDSCRGDSGGPLYIRGADGEYCLLGATSRGVRSAFTICGDGGIYVRVDLCRDWILDETGEAL